MKKLDAKRTLIAARDACAVAETGDGHIALATERGELKIIDPETGKRVYSLEEKFGIDDLVVVNDVVIFVSTGTKYTYTKEWKYKKNKRAKTLYKSEYRSDHIVNIGRETGSYVAIFSDRFRILVLRLSDGACVAELAEDGRHSEFIHVSQLANGDIVWLSMNQGFNKDNTMLFNVYDPAARETTKSLDITKEDLESGFELSYMSQIVYSSWAPLANEQFAIGYYNGAVRIWGTAPGQKTRYFQASSSDINSIAGVSDALFATEDRGKINLWCLDSLEAKGSLSISKDSLKLMKQLSGNQLACVNSKGQLEILDFSGIDT